MLKFIRKFFEKKDHFGLYQFDNLQYLQEKLEQASKDLETLEKELSKSKPCKLQL